MQNEASPDGTISVAIADLREKVARIEGALNASQRAKEQWFREPSIIISVLALLFSFGTTGFSYLRTHQQDIHDARSELRTLIQRLNRIPVENMEYSKKYDDDASLRANISGLLNNENALVAKQAADVINLIPNNVGGTEYLAVANALVQSGLADKALRLFYDGLSVVNDVNDESNILRAYGSVLFATGDIENGRAQYRKALDVFTKYAVTNNYYIESTHFLTEPSWAIAELSVGQCDYANQHAVEAEHHLLALGPGILTTQFREQLNTGQSTIKTCSAKF